MVFISLTISIDAGLMVGKLTDNAEVVASGRITIHTFDSLEQITNFLVKGQTLSGNTSVLSSFGKIFPGKFYMPNVDYQPILIALKERISNVTNR